MEFGTVVADEKVATMFQPDILAPYEYLKTFMRRAPLESGERLMLAILQDAIACFQKYVFSVDGRGKALFRDAEEWILETDCDWVFSFENVCDCLGFDPGCVRDGLMRWKEKELERRSGRKPCSFVKPPPHYVRSA